MPALIVLFAACESERPSTINIPTQITDPAQDADRDGALAADDCNDNDPSVYPGAPELCDGIDNNCNQQVDETPEDGTTIYADRDGDGFGDPADSLVACEAGQGWVTAAGDCNDEDDTIHPDANELCDGIDRDCNGLVDDDAEDALVQYTDTDGDGFGDAATEQLVCAFEDDAVINGADCDDTDASVSPAQAEVCNDIDDDCNGTVDDDPADGAVFHQDFDGDGYGDPGVEITACEVPSGFVSMATDCDDADATVYPDAAEYCDSIDNDCDGTLDEDAVDADIYYVDGDGDGYGSTTTVASCTGGSGLVTNTDDCDDTDDTVNPDAIDVCSDSIDNDCDPTTVCTTWYDTDADYSLYGETDNGRVGTDLADAGDVNGDGYADVTVTSHAGNGRGYLIHGPVTATDSIEVRADVQFDHAGPGTTELWEFEAIGDTDGDGFDDLLMGNPSGAGYSGEAHIWYGPVTADTTTKSADVVATGSTYDMGFGAVAQRVDFNGDGNDDLAVGLRLHPFTFATGSVDRNGTAVVVYGPLSANTTVSSADVTVQGDDIQDFLGTDLRSAGDVDGDGMDDLLAGAPGVDDGATDAGAAYVIYGGTSGVGLSASTTASEILGVAASDQVGEHVASAGDVNNDGFDDILVSNTDMTETYLFFGPVKSATTVTSADAILSSSTKLNVTDGGGNYLDSGDIDSDGYDDVLLSFGDTLGGTGTVHLMYGPTTGSITLSVDSDVEIVGTDTSSMFGFSGRVLGDIDGAGGDDLAISAKSASVTATGVGRGEVLLFTAGTLP